MENMVWIIYLIDVVCGSWVGLMIVLITFLIISLGFKLFILTGFDILTQEEIDRYDKIPVNTTIFLSCFLLFALNFVPSKETAYKMLAVYGVNEVYQNKDVQEIMGDGLDILKMTLKDYKKNWKNRINSYENLWKRT